MNGADAAERAGQEMVRLVQLMDRLRSECPWDRKQTFSDLSGYLLEECYEALDALRREDLDDLEGELGDLLLQIVFLAKLGAERRALEMASVIRRIHEKMVARHPHVFGDAVQSDADGVRVQWEQIKSRERKAKGGPSDEVPSPFEGIPATLPALLKAVRLTSRAADLGFDWQRESDVVAKLREEVDEFEAEVLAPGAPRERIAHEVGDILFTVVNVARRHRVDPEAALQATNAKFRRRFESVAQRLADGGREVAGTPLEELDRIWDQVKSEESALQPPSEDPRGPTRSAS